MNSQSQLFSHQRKVVEKLSHFFDHVDVITAEDFHDLAIRGVDVYSTNWVPGQTNRNVFKFYRVALPLLWRHRRGIIFSHMTQIQTFLTLPLSWLFGLRHFLWYAHKSYSLSLRICYPFLDALITSTPGSCPVSGERVFPIGQAVDTNISDRISKLPTWPPKSFYHISRMDPSKNIERIVEALLPYHQSDRSISLTFYGAPSSEETMDYFEQLKYKFSGSDYSDWVHFEGPIDNKDLAQISLNHDAFIHAFWGSLDKALVEAIMLKRIVISSNPEYLREFYGKVIQEKEIVEELRKQLSLIYSSSSSDIIEEIDRKSIIVLKNHGLEAWTTRLLAILGEK